MKKLWNWIRQLFGKKVKLPDVIKSNEETVSCGCDLSMPKDIPLCPELGSSDELVDTNLRARWAAGMNDGCGGLPGDVRPLLIRPNGKTFGWKDVILSGAIKININDDKMTIWCGTYTQPKTKIVQRLHIIGCSDHEMPPNCRPETLVDWTPIVPGVEGPRKHFAYFEVRKVNHVE